MYRYDASYAIEVQRAHPDRFALVKPVDPADPGVAETIAASALYTYLKLSDVLKPKPVVSVAA